MAIDRLVVRSDTRYELPPSGTTLLHYVVRRMHKTELLAAAAAAAAAGRPEQALIQAALYGLGASVSYGPAYYQPAFDAVSGQAEEADPATGAQVSARLVADRPHLRVAYRVALSDGTTFGGEETILGTTVGLGGLGMPAPARMRLEAGPYWAELAGTITSELAPGLFRAARIRAFGSLTARDSAGNQGDAMLSRSGDVQIRLKTPAGQSLSQDAAIRPALRSR